MANLDPNIFWQHVLDGDFDPTRFHAMSTPDLLAFISGCQVFFNDELRAEDFIKNNRLTLSLDQFQNACAVMMNAGINIAKTRKMN